MKKRYELLLTAEESEELKRRANAIGFTKMSEYLRFMAFSSLIDDLKIIRERLDNAR